MSVPTASRRMPGAARWLRAGVLSAAALLATAGIALATGIPRRPISALARAAENALARAFPLFPKDAPEPEDAAPFNPMLEARLDELRQSVETDPIEVVAQGTVIRTTTWPELGVALDRSETRRRLGLAARATSATAIPSAAMDFAPVFRVDGSRLESVMAELKAQLDTRAEPPRYEWSTGTVVKAHPGRSLDIDQTHEAMFRAARTNQHRFELALAPIEHGAVELLTTELRPNVVVAKYETRFRRDGREASRARNIEVAASHLDGLILLPGKLVSFNEVVGERSLDNGFEESFVIYKGEMVPGLGGGTCQVSSTLHAAAFLGGLDIVDRLPHSRVLGYIPAGLDSTVAWPAVDLKLRNPFPAPVVIRATVHGRVLSVELHAARRLADVRISRQTLEVFPFERHVEVKPWFKPTRVKQRQKGVLGYRVAMTRRITLPDGSSESERRVDRYHPAPELYDVGREVDVDVALPPLPPEAQSSPGAPAAQPARARASSS